MNVYIDGEKFSFNRPDGIDGDIYLDGLMGKGKTMKFETGRMRVFPKDGIGKAVVQASAYAAAHEALLRIQRQSIRKMQLEAFGIYSPEEVEETLRAERIRERHQAIVELESDQWTVEESRMNEVFDWFHGNAIAGAVMIVLFFWAFVSSIVAVGAQTTNANVQLSGMLDGAKIECEVVKGK